jgi:hypothetical protein
MKNIGGAGFNKYAAGAKKYGVGIVGPNTGMKLDQAGYKERSTKQRAKNSAMLKYIQNRNSARLFAAPQAKIGKK